MKTEGFKTSESERRAMARWRLKNPNYRRNYYLQHKDQEKKKNLGWRERNIDKWKEYMKMYWFSGDRRSASKSEYYKKWRIENRERKNWHTRRRWANLHNAEGSHTLKEWNELKKRYGYICPFCKRKEPEIELTEDHIVPLSKEGTDYIENIQPLCKSCNSKKATQIKVFKPVLV